MAKLHHFLRPSYSVSKPFHFSALTWSLVVFFGTGLALLFTFTAVATNAYELQPTYSTQPNKTLANQQWFQKQPFKTLGSVQSSCQEVMLTVGERYITSNDGFVYTIDRMWHHNGAIGDLPEVLTQLSYHDQTLEKCAVSDITINLQRMTNARNLSNSWTWGATTAKANISCSIHTLTIHEPYYMSYTVDLPRTLDYTLIASNFLVRNSSINPSMWNGVHLVAEWYSQVALAMAYAAPPSYWNDTDDAWAEGTIKLTRNHNVSDYKSLDFFYVDVAQPTEKGNLAGIKYPDTIKTWHRRAPGTEPARLPDTSITVDAFGKSFYSLLLSDFGVYTEDNALNTTQGMQYLQNITDVSGLNASRSCPGTSCRAGRIQQIINDESTTKHPPTRLSARYLCSVPQEKSTISIIYAVILADLVFLQACWKLFSTIAAWWIVHKNKSNNYCEGCNDSNDIEAQHEMRQLPDAESRERLIASTEAVHTRDGEPA